MGKILTVSKQVARLEYILLRLLTRFFLGKKRRNELIQRKIIDINHFMHKHFLDKDVGVIKVLNKEEAYVIGQHCIIPLDVGGFIASEANVVYTKPDESDVVIDVGAHYGLYTLLASRLVGNQGIVLAFEPHPYNYKRLLINLRLNKIKNVKTFNLALGDFKGQTKLYLFSNSGGHSTTPEVLSASSFDGYINVKVNTIDTIIRKLGIEKVSLIKIDAEGAELNILKGARESIQTHGPKLTIASYHYSNEAIEIKEWLETNFPFFKVKIEKHHSSNFLYAEPYGKEKAIKK
jgi:FkbM family methyltransferase